MAPLNRRYYVFRGTLSTDAPSYVTRQADRDLLEGLREGEFCTVLSSRQMGKSSLMVRTARQLIQEGRSVAIVDLTAIGRNLTVAQWYLGLLTSIGEWLGMEDEIEAFWNAHECLSPLQRWTAALRDVALAKDDRSVVIFIDEIDFVLTLSFPTDEFFAAIRECYNRRSQDPAFNSLTFCLLGVATPSDLIRDTRATPFNIGRRVQVTDFTPAEAASLAKGLCCRPLTAEGPEGAGERANTLSREGRGAMREQPESTAQRVSGDLKLIERVLFWTGGHPYLTQRLCHKVAECGGRTAADVDIACGGLFLSASVREQEDNLTFVRDRLLAGRADRADLLSLYARVWSGKRVPNDETNPFVSILKLSGIVRVEDGLLRVRNRIYARAFDKAWVVENMPDAEMRRQRAAYRRGVARAALSSASILAIVITLAFMAVKSAYVAREKERQARESLYSVDLTLGMQAWMSGNVDFARRILNKHAKEDIRGFEWHLLAHLCRGDEFWRSEPSRQSINAVAFSPDGAIMATAADDGVVVLWNMRSYRPIRLGLKHSGGANSLAFAPDGRILAVGWGDGTVSLWELAGGQETLLRDPRVTSKYVQRVVFSRDSTRLATACYDGTVALWTIATGRLVWRIDEDEGNVQSLAFAPDGKSLAVGTYDRVVRRDASSGRPLASLPVDLGFVQCVQFSPKGRWLAASGFGCNVWLWDMASGKRSVLPTTHLGSVASLAFSTDESLLATGGTDDTLSVWRLSEGRFEKVRTFRGHTDSVTSVAFHPLKKKLLATSSADGTVRLWDTMKPAEPRRLTGDPGPILSVAISQDRRWLAAGSNHGAIVLWDLDRLDAPPIRLPRAHSDKVYSLAFSPDGKALASASADFSVKLWRLNQGTLQMAASWHGKNRMLAVAFSRNGALMAAIGWDNIARVWRMPDAEHDREIFSRHQDKYRALGKTDLLEGNALAISPDSGTLTAYSKGHKIYLWKLAAGPAEKPDIVTAFDDTKVNTMAFSPDGRILAYGNEARALVLCDLKTQIQTPHTGHTAGIWSLAFSPDGRTIATGSPDLTVKLWNTRLENEVTSLSGHTNAVMAVAFSADGKLVVSADYNGELILWSADDRDHGSY